MRKAFFLLGAIVGSYVAYCGIKQLTTSPRDGGQRWLSQVSG
jgi:hypothetical protein